MTTRRHAAALLPALLTAAIAAAPAFGQGRGPGMMGDAAHAADMQVFHQLFEHRTEIKRQVTKLANGIETLTESSNPEVTRLLQAHVASMLARVDQQRAIHRRDPLFAELFSHADRIAVRHEMTEKGVHVFETSYDPYVVSLLQAHADVIDAFLANGRSEMMKNHPLPARPKQ